MEKQSNHKLVPFEKVIDALLDEQKPFPATYLHRFSDLSPVDLSTLEKNWLQIQPSRRENVLRDLCAIQEADTLVCFDEVGKLALLDPQAAVRLAGIDLIWDAGEPRLIPRLVLLLQTDEEVAVRAAAGGALGPYVLQGELEEMDASLLKKIEDILIDIVRGQEEELVRRRCLEALGFSSREEVPALIQNAFNQENPSWKASALFAMGRSADSHWKKSVLGCLRDPHPEIQIEAIRAAGELELKEARSPLLSMIPRYEEMDEELQQAIIWSLSQIGGEKVAETLDKLMEAAENEDMVDFIQDALDNLEFNESLDGLELIQIDFPDEDGLMIEDLLDEDDDTPAWSETWDDLEDEDDEDNEIDDEEDEEQ